MPGDATMHPRTTFVLLLLAACGMAAAAADATQANA